MSNELQITIFGSLQVKVAGKTAVFRTDAQRVLLAYLAARQGVPQRRDTLAGLLSPDRPDKEALTYLRNRLARLRHALGDETAVPPYLIIDRKQIALRGGDGVMVDVVQFDRLLTAVENHPHRQLAGCPVCMERLQTAVDLVGGEFLAGLNFPSETWEAWLLAQREHYQQRGLEAMALLRDAKEARGEWTAVLDVAQQQLRREPWLESAHRAAMRASYHLDDRNGALAQFARCVDLLAEELGVEPEAETVELQRQILADELGSARETAVNHNLPAQTDRFIGREAEQTTLLERLVNPAHRLTTIVGVGGVGKTRLALEIGRRAKASFPDGVWFVSLEAIKGGAEQIQIAVGEAARLAPTDKQLTGDQVLAILRDKQALLIFDNCETALDDLAFVPEWLRRAPHIALLATSREPLNFQAETAVMLDGLPTGEAEISAAEALFVERGQMARSDFAATADNLPQIRRICTLVDGSPLAISLAATWVRRRSLGQIIDAIGRSLDFLSVRLRDLDPRHRSMRAVFETSWGLLTPDEQAALAALAVFPTTFTENAAVEITGTSLFDIDLLCEKSLLQQQHEVERYSMHSLVRQFAAEKLADRADEIDRAFIDYFYRFAVAQQDDYAALQPEWRNLLSGMIKAHRLGDWQTTLNFGAALDEPWFRQIRFNDMREGLALTLEAAAALQDRPALAQTHLRLSEIEIELNHYAAAKRHLDAAMEALMRLEDSLGVAQGNYLYGRIHLEKAEDEQTIAFCTESMHIFESEGDKRGVAKNLNLLALSIIRKQRDYQTAHDYLKKSVELQQALPPTATYVESLRHLARVKSVRQEFAAAEAYLAEATAITERQNNIGEYAAVLYERLVLCKKQGRWDEALRFGYEALENFKKFGSLRWQALLKTQLGLLHQAKENVDQALPLLQDSLQLFTELDDRYEQAHLYFYLHKLHAIRNEREESKRAWEQAYNLNLELQDPRLTERLNDRS